MSEADGNDVADPVARALSALPQLSAEQIPNLDDACPICLISFRTILDKSGSEALGRDIEGVTKVEACGHVFCAEDLSEWIRGRHGTCPACRHEFVPELRPVDSDAESEDDDYVPTEYDADSDFDTDDDGFLDSDGIDIETMDIEADQAPVEGATASMSRRRRDAAYFDDREVDDGELWWDEGLTDGESMTTSEEELSIGERLPGSEMDIQVHLNSEGEYSIEDEGQPAPKRPNSDGPM
ncbi:hypothetical protein FA95DRAFT_1674179 [Auriscalpium vulgare]|uniref:Uncharacterized protein n=1 Tax=Auriscalpium vulgare TaxID=40419 RepID=A0ACB8SCH9_9AGAM|nr:hypothetical protein FA95DRAFT_1674179 [Auriscalpium vulgare]